MASGWPAQRLEAGIESIGPRAMSSITDCANWDKNTLENTPQVAPG
jgi:hypothetical protein